MLCSLNHPQATCQRDIEDAPGILQHGPIGRLLGQELPDPAWLAPEDLQRPFMCAHAVQQQAPMNPQSPLCKDSCRDHHRP